MPNAPLISVLLPTHNRSKVLGLAIESVLRQSVAELELLVVGDGCTDDTAAVVGSFDDSRIKWFDLPKAPGFGYANRNVALKEARGDLVAFLGHDNLYFHDHVERMLAPFAHPAVQFAYSRPLWIRDDGLIIPFFANLALPPVRRRFLSERNVLPATCVVHRRSCLDDVGLWPEDTERSGDWDLWKRMLNRYGASSVRLVRQPTCLHFRADWRDPTRWAPLPVPYVSALADAGRFWPGELQLRLGGAEEGLPQEQVGARLLERGEKLVASIRTGVEYAQDQLAWNAGLDPGFEV